MSSELRHMSRAGKTFFFASLWLERSVRRDIAAVYAFCRSVDDIADDQPAGPERSRTLAQVVTALKARNAEHPVAGRIIPLLGRYPGIFEPAVDLVETCLADGTGLRIETEQDLIEYAHGVAGNVGLMVYPILGGEDSHGLACADDLGIAMQCTNIARDVLADLRQGRVYLPREWVGTDEVSALLRGDLRAEGPVVEAVTRLLDLARRRYERGLAGLSYLNPRARFAIRVAADCYAAIGDRVIREGRLARERAVVPFGSKVLVAFRAMQGWRQPTAQLAGS